MFRHVETCIETDSHAGTCLKLHKNTSESTRKYRNAVRMKQGFPSENDDAGKEFGADFGVLNGARRV